MDNVFSMKVEDKIAVIVMDLPGESVNKLNSQFLDSMDQMISQIESDPEIIGGVLISGKPGNFVAGADIEEFLKLKTLEEAEALSRKGQLAIHHISLMKKPFVAAVNGACMGGGTETILGCHYRIATTDRSTVIAVPEVKIGLLPGAGGTQRLPRLLGIQKALDMILSGRNVSPKEALKIGLVDDVVEKEILLETAKQAVRGLADGSLVPKRPDFMPKPPKGPQDLPKLLNPKMLQNAMLEETEIGHYLIFQQAEKELLSKTGGHYPAPVKALESVRRGMRVSLETGLKIEAKLFAELAMSDVCRKLIGIFFATTALKKDLGVEGAPPKPRPVERVGVLGAGLMGAGIAAVLGDKGLNARMKDVDDKRVAAGAKYVYKVFEPKLNKGRMSKAEFDAKLARVSGSTDWSGFGNVDVVIEAVFEDMALKQKILAETEANTPERCIFASNTSALPITEIASVSKKPETVIGMHFFSPVHKMPLVEVINTKKTAPDVTVTIVKLGQRMGKTVIVVNDGPGFYTTRVLVPYLDEASLLLAEGVTIEDVDDAMKSWGFPVGPIVLMDEVGIDVGSKVIKTMKHAFGDRIEAPEGVEKLLADNRLGRKNKRGFYLYEDQKNKKKGAAKKQVDKSVYQVLGVESHIKMDREEIQKRISLAFVNESAWCLQENILRCPRDGDIGAMFGLGFPPFRGGPFRLADDLGLGNVVKQLEELQSRHGKRFGPAPILMDMAKAGKKFYND